MDALLPPLELESFAVVELAAPPELNENSDMHASPMHEVETSIVDDPNTSAPAAVLDDAVDHGGNDGSQSPVAEPTAALIADDCVHVVSPAQTDLQPEQSRVEPQIDDLIKNEEEFVEVAEADEQEKDPASVAEDTLNDIIDTVVSEIKGSQADMSPCDLQETTENNDDYEQPTIKECSIVVDKRDVVLYLRNQRRRIKRREERELAEISKAEVAEANPQRSSRASVQRNCMPILTRLVCKLCHESFLDSRPLRAHFRVKHVDNLDEFISVCGRVKQYILCPLCQSTFRAKTDFTNHMAKLHSMGRHVFDSVDCYDDYFLGDMVARYLSKKMNPIFSCEICGKICSSAKGVNVHKQVSKECSAIIIASRLKQKPSVVTTKAKATVSVPQEQVKAPERVSRSKAGPKSVMASWHKEAPQAAPATASTSNTNQNMVCEWCRDRLKTTTQLNTHLRSKHSVPEHFSPEGCNLPDFFTALEHHFTVTEREENSYECVSCKETFLEKIGLLEHFSGEHLKSKVVGMQIKLQCGICGHENNDVGNLHDHMWNAHANQKLEDMVIRVGDVSRTHRCGEECTLLWKKPVISVAAAPRPPTGSKRPSSEVKAMPRSVKRMKFGMQAIEDDDEMMRQIEEEEEKVLREQEDSYVDVESMSSMSLEEQKREKRRLYNMQYKQRRKELAAGFDKNNSILKSTLQSMNNEVPVVNKPVRSMNFLEPGRNVDQSFQNRPTQRSGGSRSSLKPSGEQSRAAFPSPAPRPQTARRSAPAAASSTQGIRCATCMLTFPDIISMMKHKKVCPSPTTATTTPAAPAASAKSAQFVLMDEDESHQDPDLRCHGCQTSYSSVGELNAHIQSMHCDKLTCEICSATFKHESKLSAHISRSHNINYTCLICDSPFTNKKVFISHMQGSHKVERHVFANVTLKNYNQIKEIFDRVVFPSLRQQASAPKPKPRSSSSKMKKSKAPSHRPNLPKVKIETAELPVLYQCELCEVCYPSQEEIKQHMEYVH